MRFAPSIICGLLTLYCFQTTASDKEPVTIAAMMKIKNVIELKISPDGSKTVFVIAQADFQSNSYHLSLWGTSNQSSKPTRLSDSLNVQSVCWAPNSKQIAYFTGNQNGSFICIGNTKHTKPTHTIEIPSGATKLSWSSDGSYLTFLAPDEDLAKLKQSRLASFTQVGEDLDRAQLYLVNLKTKKNHQLTHTSDHISNYAWSPDSKRIAFGSQPSSRINDKRHTDLYLLDLETTLISELVKRPGADSTPKWSPDGTKIAFVSQNNQGTWLAQYVLCIVLLKDGSVEELSDNHPENVSTDSDGHFWVDNQTIYFGTVKGVTTQLFSLDTNSKAIHQITKGNYIHDRFSLSRDGTKMAFLVDQPAMPGNLYFSLTSEYNPKQLTRLNSHLEHLSVSEVTTVRWKSDDGTPIEGILFKPGNTTPSTRYPLITHLHGGPSGGFLRGFVAESRLLAQADFCPAHVLTSRGFAVFCPNPRGSDGHGQTFRNAVVRDWGNGDLQDVLSGIEYLVTQKVADPDRLALTGYCYGGYLSLCALTKSDRFKTASLGACFGDLYGLQGQTDIPDFFVGHFGEVPWKARNLYSQHSPIFSSQKVTASVLLQHGESDDRIPVTQSRQIFTAIKDLNPNNEMLIYPDQEHLMTRPRVNAECMRRNVLWFDQHLKNE